MNLDSERSGGLLSARRATAVRPQRARALAACTLLKRKENSFSYLNCQSQSTNLMSP